MAGGAQVLLVSSGAVGLGRLRLGLSKDVVSDPANVVDRQVLPSSSLLLSSLELSDTTIYEPNQVLPQP